MSEYRDSVREVTREGLWTLPRFILAWFVVMVLIYGIGFLATGGNLFIYKFWAPKKANAERQVFVNTNSYVQGKTDYLNRLRLAYKSSDSVSQKAALKETILSEAANIDTEKLPVDLQGFIQSLKGEF